MLIPYSIARSVVVGGLLAAPAFASPLISAGTRDVDDDGSFQILPFRLGHAAANAKGVGESPPPRDLQDGFPEPGLATFGVVCDDFGCRRELILSDPAPPIVQRPSRRKGCHGGKQTKGIAAKFARRMQELANRVRMMLGFPVVPMRETWAPKQIPKFHHHPWELVHEEIVAVDMIEPQTNYGFIARLETALRNLGPWEARAVTFVIGCGLGALLRMLVVFTIIMVRGRRACRRSCRRREASGIAPCTPFDAAPPAYAVNTGGPTSDQTKDSAPKSEKQITEKEVSIVKEVVTVDQEEDGILMVYWISVDGTEVLTPAIDFRKEHPQELINFYQSHLKWRAELD